MRNYSAWIGAKFGTLTVEKYLGKTANSDTFFLVRCDCGKTKKVKTGDFMRGNVKSCGRLFCKRATSGKLLSLPKPPKDDTDPESYNSAIEARIKPKYYCKAVALECTISTLLHVCCCECDRPCKRCENTPQKCGARVRARRRTE